MTSELASIITFVLFFVFAIIMFGIVYLVGKEENK